MTWLLTCEHYGNAVPPSYERLFQKAQAVLKSHRGYDIGVAELYENLIPCFDRHFHFPWTRLIIEPNRSLRHRHLFSPFTLQLSVTERQSLISSYYQPYRTQVESSILSMAPKSVLHLSAHTFTPQLGSEWRAAQIGILFDPKRPQEKEFAQLLKAELAQRTEAKIRFNYPYRGVADGFTTYLRKVFPKGYTGIELEVRNNEVTELKDPIAASIKALRTALR